MLTWKGFNYVDSLNMHGQKFLPDLENQVITWFPKIETYSWSVTLY